MKSDFDLRHSERCFGFAFAEFSNLFFNTLKLRGRFLGK